jgi:hypothetical protein
MLESHPDIHSVKELMRACNRIAERPEGEGDFIKQQNLQRFLTVNEELADDLASSKFLPVIADALGIRAVWLQMGVGSPRDDRLEKLKRVVSVLEET